MLLLSLALLSRPALALTKDDLVESSATFLETTLIIGLAFTMVMALSLQLARGYFLRILNKFTLRLGADIWWLTYVLIRDGLIFMSFIMGLLIFLPGTIQDYEMAVPFMPIAVLLFGVALVLKLYFDADDDRKVFRTVTILLSAGTGLWLIGMLFVTETPTAMPTLPTGLSADSGFWATVFNLFSSTTNVNLAWMTFQVSFVALAILGLLVIAHPLLHSRAPKAKELPKSDPPETNRGPV